MHGILAVFSARDGLGFDFFDRALAAGLGRLLSNRSGRDRKQKSRNGAATAKRDESAHDNPFNLFCRRG